MSRTATMEYTLTDLAIGHGGKPLVSHICTTLRPDSLCALLGANGAGKTTLLRTMAGFLPPVAGEMTLGDTSVRRASPATISRLIAVVLTDRVEAPGLTARQIVEAGRSPHTNFWGRLTPADRLAVSRAMSLAGVLHLADRPAHTLSDGERQKILIAKALAQDTPVMLLDEPTAFLDFPSRVDTMLLLSRLARRMRKAILMSTHDIDLALQVADTLWLLDGGDQPHLTVGTPHALARSGALSRTFSGPHAQFDSASLRILIRR